MLAKSVGLDFRRGGRAWSGPIPSTDQGYLSIFADDAALSAYPGRLLPLSHNRSVLVAGYGSLLSGYGLLAERRGGRSRLVARNAWPLAIQNACRGLAKPSSHGSYLAMDIEPEDPAAPISARAGRAESGEVGGILLEFEREWFAAVARREEYDPAEFERLVEKAEAAGKPLGEFLIAIAERVSFDADAYRRELREMLGYTSPGYIFHPVPLADGRVAIIAIGSGYHSSGDPAVVSRRRECEIDRLLGLDEALELRKPQLVIDRVGQVGYFAECVLGGLHGLSVGDLLAGVGTDGERMEAVVRLLKFEAEGERDRFLRATSLDPRGYEERFDSAPDSSVTKILSIRV